MLIARELRKTNIAEYILYMWQIEDLLRACAFDSDEIENQLVKRFNADEKTSQELTAWYNNLALMMENEHIQEKGHLQVLINLINDLNEFHLKLLEVENDQEYLRLNEMNKLAINEIVQKSNVANAIEACLNALYGVLVLKLKKAEISQPTLITVQELGKMIGHLSARYIQFENDNFEF
jgi:hypothetical protein